MAACFGYASTNVHSVNVPPHKLYFTHQPLEWIQKEVNEVWYITAIADLVCIKIDSVSAFLSLEIY